MIRFCGNSDFSVLRNGVVIDFSVTYSMVLTKCQSGQISRKFSNITHEVRTYVKKPIKKGAYAEFTGIGTTL